MKLFYNFKIDVEYFNVIGFLFIYFLDGKDENSKLYWKKFKTFLSKQKQWEQFQHLEAAYFRPPVSTFQTSPIAFFLILSIFLFEKLFLYKRKNVKI